MTFIFYFNSILLGAGLAMDAFSVSLANGLAERKMHVSKMCMVAGTFAGFQFLMPMIGWICVHTIAQRFEAFEKFIPWIALFLLLYIGGNMLIGALKKDEEEVKTGLTAGALLIQGIATSIDALSVGFTIADYSLVMAWICSLIIGAVTFVICMFGLGLGKKFGMRFANKAEVLGGIILIFIGIEIFVKGMFF